MTDGKEREVTREALYDQVWAKPLRTLAAEHGLSDVGLAKVCTRLNVPRPPVGHWVRLQHGNSVERPPLLPAMPGQPTTATIRPTSLRSSVPDRDPPVVVVAESLTRPHPAVHLLLRRIRERQPDEHGILVVRGEDGAVFRTSKAARDRALRILDALFKAVEGHGHPVTATESLTVGYRRERFRMMATVSGQEIDVFIGERFTQREHVRTAREEQSYRYIPRFEFIPSGDLVLHLGPKWGRCSTQRAWSDGKKRRLEQMLGRAVEAFALIADDRTRRQQAWAQQEAEVAEHARLHAIEQAKAEHQKALAADLADMANAWVTANRIRDFLGALEARLPADARAEGTSAWLAWAHQHAAVIDPLGEPDRVAKRLEPNLVKLGLA
jgi:hypothetical protein